MKILSGTYKGIRIETTKNASYRPTKSRVRKSIFDILSPFHYANILDLYSGSGILGFESASRGATSVTFVENNFKNIKLLTHNKVKFNDIDFSVIKNNVETFLKKSEKKFDLIFADPPYGKVDYEWLFNSCKEKISKSGKLVVEMNNNNFTYNNCVEKIYGETKVMFYNKI